MEFETVIEAKGKIVQPSLFPPKKKFLSIKYFARARIWKKLN